MYKKIELDETGELTPENVEKMKNNAEYFLNISGAPLLFAISALRRAHLDTTEDFKVLEAAFQIIIKVNRNNIEALK
jgi:hypothetical protein